MTPTSHHAPHLHGRVLLRLRVSARIRNFDGRTFRFFCFFAFATRADLLLVSSSSLLYRRYYDHRETGTAEFAMGFWVLLVLNFGRFAWSTLLGLWDAWQRLQHYITSTGWDWAADYEHWDIGVSVVWKRRVRGHLHEIRWACLFRNEMVSYSHPAFHEWFLFLLLRVKVMFSTLRFVMYMLERATRANCSDCLRICSSFRRLVSS